MEEAKGIAVVFWGAVLLAPIWYVIAKFLSRNKESEEMPKEPRQSATADKEI